MPGGARSRTRQSTGAGGEYPEVWRLRLQLARALPPPSRDRGETSPLPDDITQLRDFINSVPFIDTHSHMAGFDEGSPVDDRGGRSLPQIIANDYLSYLASSCVEVPPPPRPEGWRVEDAEGHFGALQPLLDVCRGLSTYAALREGIRELHPFEGEDITPDNWEALNDSIVRAYRTHGERAWQRQVSHREGLRLALRVSLPVWCPHAGALAATDPGVGQRLRSEARQGGSVPGMGPAPGLRASLEACRAVSTGHPMQRPQWAPVPLPQPGLRRLLRSGDSPGA